MSGIENVSRAPSVPAEHTPSVVVKAKTEGPPSANPQPTEKEIAGSKQTALQHITNFLKQADAWPYSTKIEKGEVVKELIQPAKSDLGRLGFGMIKLIKDTVLLGPRLGAGLLGGIIGGTMIAGALITAPFSNELRGKLLTTGITLASGSLIGGFSGIGRLVGSMANLAVPLIKEDVTISFLNKMVIRCFAPIAQFAVKAGKAWSEKTQEDHTVTKFNPSDPRYDSLDDQGSEIEDAPPKIEETENPDEKLKKEKTKTPEEKLQFGESTRKIMGFVSTLAGFFTLSAAFFSESKIKSE